MASADIKGFFRQKKKGGSSEEVISSAFSSKKNIGKGASPPQRPQAPPIQPRFQPSSPMAREEKLEAVRYGHEVRSLWASLGLNVGRGRTPWSSIHRQRSRCPPPLLRPQPRVGLPVGGSSLTQLWFLSTRVIKHRARPNSFQFPPFCLSFVFFCAERRRTLDSLINSSAAQASTLADTPWEASAYPTRRRTARLFSLQRWDVTSSWPAPAQAAARHSVRLGEVGSQPASAASQPIPSPPQSRLKLSVPPSPLRYQNTQGSRGQLASVLEKGFEATVCVDLKSSSAENARYGVVSRDSEPFPNGTTISGFG
ncbi:hypothetical protein HPP92_001688 [Vanilla planifolia]|uniref:Uncharacterized protein n=1 Tax=Vanilla planifolia TaxID=51239 RepID=A0A835S872_VANPL|nr:hypothetical protein HPP92_001688 [Vanilla planifolia]